MLYSKFPEFYTDGHPSDEDRSAQAGNVVTVTIKRGHNLNKDKPLIANVQTETIFISSIIKNKYSLIIFLQ